MIPGSRPLPVVKELRTSEKRLKLKAKILRQKLSQEFSNSPNRKLLTARNTVQPNLAVKIRAVETLPPIKQPSKP